MRLDIVATAAAGPIQPLHCIREIKQSHEYIIRMSKKDLILIQHPQQIEACLNLFRVQ